MGPDGLPLRQSGQYPRINPDRLIAFTFRWDDGDAPQTEVAVAFSAGGDKTLVTFRQSPFDSAARRDSHLEGWRECLDRLGEGLQEAGR